MDKCNYRVFNRTAVAACLMSVLVSAFLPDRPALGAGDLPAMVVLVRHAEKAGAPFDPDPDLTADGVMRARDLATALRDAHLTAIVTTQYRPRLPTHCGSRR
jgi:hypothetical protein